MTRSACNSCRGRSTVSLAFLYLDADTVRSEVPHYDLSSFLITWCCHGFVQRDSFICCNRFQETITPQATGCFSGCNGSIAAFGCRFVAGGARRGIVISGDLDALLLHQLFSFLLISLRRSVSEFFESLPNNDLPVGDWTRIEFTSRLVRDVRMSVLHAGTAGKIGSQFKSLIVESVIIL